jgi:hypothetical protein
LSSLLAKGPVVVTFYRGGWCPWCDLQLRAYQQVLPEIHRLGAELAAISPQTPDYAIADVEKKQLEFPVLTDAHNAVARRYGLVFMLSDALKALQTAFGNPIPKFNGDGSWELPMPGDVRARSRRRCAARAGRSRLHAAARAGGDSRGSS